MEKRYKSLNDLSLSRSNIAVNNCQSVHCRHMFNGAFDLGIEKQYMVEVYSHVSLQVQKTNFFYATSVFMQLVYFMLEQIDANLGKISVKGKFSSEFYESCVENAALEAVQDLTDDPEILTIYFEQLVIILKNAKILVCQNQEWQLLRNYDSLDCLYQRIFTAFWTQVNWSGLFPSMPAVATALQENNNLIKDILLRKKKPVSLNVFAKEFIQKSGVSFQADLFFVSFCDFYLFQWLRILGIIEYDKNSTSLVKVVLTDFGRSFLSSL